MKRYEGSPAVVIERRKGTPDSPFSNMNESLVVASDGKVVLTEIPNELNRVIVTSEDNATWYEITNGQIPENGFKVDYINKLVTFNTIHVGKQVHFKYLGEGNHYYSPNSIYTSLDEEGTVVETLGGLIENGLGALDALEKLDEKLNEVTQATNNAITATNDTRDVITEGNQVIETANTKIADINSKIGEVTTKITELDSELDEAKTTITDVQQKSTVVESIITDGQGVINNAQLLLDEVKSAGNFDLATFFKKNNTVLDKGSTWIALQDTQNNPLPVLPITENAYWRLTSLHGAKGDKGDTGAALSIQGKLTDVSQLPPTGQAGHAYTVNGELYVWSENTNEWENVGNIKGEKGDKGDTGENGLSAYQVAVNNGFVGTLEEWLVSLKGEKGDKGQDADLTEVNQEISNLQQTVINNQQVVNEHLSQMATTEKAGHVMLVSDLTTGGANKAASAETVKILKAELDKTIKVNTYNANKTLDNLGTTNVRKSFGRFTFTNDTTSEFVAIDFNTTTIFGMFKISLASAYANINSSGGAEVICHVGFVSGTLYRSVIDIVSMPPEFANAFYIDAPAIIGGKLTWAVYKRKANSPISIDIEFYSSHGNAWTVLNDATVRQADTGVVTDAPIQQSIFQYVGDGKKTVNQAVTDMGVYTAPDATFATTAANIRAIPRAQTGTMYVPSLSAGQTASVDVTVSGFTPKNAYCMAGGIVMIDGSLGGNSLSASTLVTQNIQVIGTTVRYTLYVGSGGSGWSGGNIKYVIS